MQEDDLRKNGEIFIPDSDKLKNYKMGVGKILDLSRKAKEETKLEVGDRVLVDSPRLGSFIGRVISLASRWADIKILMDEGLKSKAVREGDVVSVDYNYIKEK